MELLLTLLSGVAAVAGGRWWWDRRKRHQSNEGEFEAARALAEEDVRLLGEELERLNADLARLGPEGRADRQQSLDAYESARRLLRGLASADQIGKVSEAMGSGWYAMACVRARLAGAPIPERRVPCFFNPQHGPATREVVFTQARRGTHTVPACRQDAERVEAGQAPDVWTVTTGARRVPYWEGGRTHRVYGAGYFSGGASVGEKLAWAFAPVVGAAGAQGGPVADRWGVFGAGHSDRAYEVEGFDDGRYD
jgi:hypothetical protein